MLEIAFALGLATAIVLLGAILMSIYSPQRRFWPPGRRSWKLYANWSLVIAFDAALAAVVYLDYDGWLLPRSPLVYALGAGFVLFGVALAFHSARRFEPEETMGLAGALYMSGPYARSRHPQYVGLILSLVGVAILANSWRATVLCAANITWLIGRAVAEERWLAREHGSEYERYREAVPRFVGVRSLRRRSE